ncbi:MAG: ATP-binding protein [Firmicutes bacterium]|nr:ATP-binding protein [Bacillota bacterium]
MREFVGRGAEMSFLEQHYGSPGSQMVVVYGSKGVGKTRLLQEFCRDRRSFYYLARACSEREQCCQWGGELREKGAAVSKYPDYEELLKASVAERETEKQVLVIDEFQHMLKGDTVFFGKLAEFMENRLSSRPVMIVLCTSASGWVENHMVEKLGSRAAAIGGFLKVRELKFAKMRRMFPGYSFEDCMRIYAVLGGVPGYWMNFRQDLSAGENIIRNILAKESRLYGEMEVYLEQELREPGVYNTILTAMARDCNKLNDIYRHTGFSRAKISVYLKNLMELDLVEKVYSYDTEGRANAQKGIYRIANPYVRFYFRYLFPNSSLLQLLSPEEFYDRKVAESYDLYVEEAYRRICREHMGREYRVVGEWLGKTGAVDIVASDGQGAVGVGACVWSRKMEYSDYEWLLFSMKKARLASKDIRLYCEQGFDDSLLRKAEEGKVKLLGIRESEGR